MHGFHACIVKYTHTIGVDNDEDAEARAAAVDAPCRCWSPPRCSMSPKPTWALSSASHNEKHQCKGGNVNLP